MKKVGIHPSSGIKALFDTRPKTVKAMFAAMMKVGVDPSELYLGIQTNTHEAPLGMNASLNSREPFPAFCGHLTTKAVKGMRSGFGHPWDNIWWLHSGTGSGDGKGNGSYSFTIWAQDVPEVTKEWEKMFEVVHKAEVELGKFNAEVQSEVQKSKNDIYKRHERKMDRLLDEVIHSKEVVDKWIDKNLEMARKHRGKL